MELINLINEEAELSVLATLLDEESIQKNIDDININIFSDKFNQAIYKAMRKIIEENKKLDIVILFEELKASNIKISTSSLSNLTLYSNKSTFEQNISILQELAQKRNLINIAEQLKQGVISGTDIDKLLYDLEERTNKIKPQEAYTDDISSIVNRFNDYLYSEGDKGFKFGLGILDDTIGGIYKGELTTIGAKSGIGKTALALQIVQSALKQDKKVLYITREMTDIHILQRLITQLTGVSAKAIKNKNLTDKQEQDVYEANKYFEQKGLYINHNISKPSEIRRRVAEIKPDLVIVDYLQLLESNKQTTSREQEVAYLSRSLKKISLDFNVAVISLTQLNDSFKGRPMGESAVRESKAIYMDSNNVIYIHKPVEFDELLKLANNNESIADQWQKINLTNSPLKLYEIIVSKSRDNGTGMDKVWYLGEILTFKNFKDINMK